MAELSNSTESRLASPSAWSPLERLAAQLRREPLAFFNGDPFDILQPVLSVDQADYWPEFEIKETDAAYIFRGDLPGTAEEDIDVRTAGNQLKVSGTRAEESSDRGDTWYARERHYGRFARQWTLPADVQSAEISAQLANGVLTITVPRSGAQVKRKIQIKQLAHRMREKLDHALHRR